MALGTCLLLVTMAFPGSAAGQPCLPGWSDRFPSADLDGWVETLAAFDDGSGPALYAGGFFTHAGGVPAPHIVRTAGHGWSTPGGGTSGMVQVMMPFDDGSGAGPRLVVGGSMSAAGGVVDDDIAQWDGQSWTPLGDGIADASLQVEALVVFDDGSGPALYAGGYFWSRKDPGIRYVARWDGKRWSAVGGGVNGYVTALVVHDDGSGPALYASGWFDEAGGVPVAHIARWDGTSWSAVGSGLNDYAGALAVFDDGGGPALCAAGKFTVAGEARADRIAKWDGTTWSALGGGLNGEAKALAVFDDGNGAGLYAAGMFTAAGGIVASHVAKWDGTTWSPLGAGTNGSVYTLAVFDEGSGPALYAGGNFGQAGGVPARQLARWTGSEWRGHGGGVANAAGGGKAYAMKAVGKGAAVDPGLYVGGEFAAAGGVAAGNIARYDAQGWHALGDGVDGEVFALCLFDDLYVGGAFKSAGGRGAAGIARWDGASWAPLGAGSEWAVRAIAVFDDGSGGGPALYASGHFGGAHIACWDGAAWSGIGSVSGGNINAMAVFNDGSGAALYAAGAFMSVNGVQAGGIARWDGSSWTALGAGFEVELSQQVNALAVYDDGRGAALYAAGRLLHSGEVAVNGIARWDGASWSSVGGGVIDSKVLSLAVFDDGLEGRPGLYAGGTFEVAGGTGASLVARWNGTFWSALGGGIGGGQYPAVYALAAFDDGAEDGPALFAGGTFTAAGGENSLNFARWRGCPVQGLPPFAPCHYEVAIIRGPPHPDFGYTNTHARAMNELGQVVGYYGISGNKGWFIWDGGPDVVALQPPTGFPLAYPQGINDAGQVAGRFQGASAGQNRGFLYEGGTWTILNPPDGPYGSSAAYAINQSGQVVGYRSDPDLGVLLGFLWQRGEFTDISPPAYNIARGVNDAGEVVGEMDFGGSGLRAYRWKDGNAIDLGVLPGYDTSRAVAINNRGEIVGSSRKIGSPGADQVIHAVLWRDGEMIDLGTLEGFTWSSAADINDSGVIVGSSFNDDSNDSADTVFLWRDGVMTALDDLIPWDRGLHIKVAAAINSSGQIAATADSQGSPNVGVLLTPVARPVGDINGNCRVDVDDLLMLLFDWGATGSPADLDGDGVVGVRDFLALLADWT